MIRQLGKLKIHFINKWCKNNDGYSIMVQILLIPQVQSILSYREKQIFRTQTVSCLLLECCIRSFPESKVKFLSLESWLLVLPPKICVYHRFSQELGRRKSWIFSSYKRSLTWFLYDFSFKDTPLIVCMFVFMLLPLCHNFIIWYFVDSINDKMESIK